MREYPAWICEPCGRAKGRRIPSCATWHVGDSCGWCGAETITTEPRDFGYPPGPDRPTGAKAPDETVLRLGRAH